MVLDGIVTRGHVPAPMWAWPMGQVGHNFYIRRWPHAVLLDQACKRCFMIFLECLSSYEEKALTCAFSKYCVLHSEHHQTSLTCVGITDQYLDWHPDNWGTLSDCKVSFERGRKIENCRSFVVNCECWIDGAAVPSMLPVYQGDMYLLNRGSSNLFIAYCLNTCNSDTGAWYLYLGYTKYLAFIFREYI